MITRVRIYRDGIQHVVHDKQHTSSYFLGNKNGNGSKLGGMQTVMDAVNDGAHGRDSLFTDTLQHSHAISPFRGNKNGNRAKLGKMATLPNPCNIIDSQNTVTHTDVPDPIVTIQGVTGKSTYVQKIPDTVYKNKYQSIDYKSCLYQNDKQFGFVPLNDLLVYMGPEVIWGRVPDVVEAHAKIKNSALPNFMALRIPVTSQLKVPVWKKYLDQYWDKQLVDLLEFSFPLDFDRNITLNSTEVNHNSALQYPDHVQVYLEEEIKYGAIYGQFDTVPFSCHFSPFLTRDKPN